MFTAFQLGITPKRPSSQSALSPNLHFYIFSYLAKVNRMQIEMVLKKMIRVGGITKVVIYISYVTTIWIIQYPKKLIGNRYICTLAKKAEIFIMAKAMSFLVQHMAI